MVTTLWFFCDWLLIVLADRCSTIKKGGICSWCRGKRGKTPILRNSFFYIYIFFNFSPLREVTSAPGLHNPRNIFGGFPICCLPVIFRVVIVVATSATHFTHQVTLYADDNLLWNRVRDFHGRFQLDGHNSSGAADRHVLFHFAWKWSFSPVDLSVKGNKAEKKGKSDKALKLTKRHTLFKRILHFEVKIPNGWLHAYCNCWVTETQTN